MYSHLQILCPTLVTLWNSFLGLFCWRGGPIFTGRGRGTLWVNGRTPTFSETSSKSAVDRLCIADLMKPVIKGNELYKIRKTR